MLRGRTCAAAGIILDVAVTGADMQDHECCVQRLEHLKMDRGFPVENVALDKGYDTIPVHYGLSKLGVTGYVGIYKRGKNTKDEMYQIDEFIYDIESDTYTCPQGKTLIRKNDYFLKDIPKKMYAAESMDCKNCAFKEKCYKGKKNHRRINRSFNQEYREAAIKRVGNDMYNFLMERRKIISEGNFGLQKRCHNLRFTRKRGNEHVTEQALMSATALNLKRLVWYGQRGENLEAIANMMQTRVA